MCIYQNLPGRVKGEKMSNLYLLRKEAFQMIATLCANGKTKEEITYKVAFEFGLDSRFVEKSLKTIKEAHQ